MLADKATFQPFDGEQTTGSRKGAKARRKAENVGRMAPTDCVGVDAESHSSFFFFASRLVAFA